MKKEKQEKKVQEPVKLNIPENEIWTYRIEGLQEPHIETGREHSFGKKLAVVLILLVAIGLSIYFSIRAVHQETYKYESLDNGTYELVKFSNPGNMTQLTVDCVDGDPAKPITVLHEYFLNCDEMLTEVTLGKSITQIDGKSFYSCWKLQNIHVDPENPAYCDIDGVLFTKDLKTVVCYPIDHDEYLRQVKGYDKEPEWWGEDYTEEYIADVMTYRLPAETETIGMLSFNYAALADLYMPEGVKAIETMAFFRCSALRKVTTFRGDAEYASLPDGLETIGSDAFSYDQALEYLYIPASVTSIGHHAFWDSVYKDKDNDVLRGVTEINVALGEDDFKHNVDKGDQWRPEYDFMLFKKKVPVNYAAERTDGNAAS